MNILAVREIEMGKYFTLTKGVNMKKWKIIKIVTIAVLVLLGQPRRFVFRVLQSKGHKHVCTNY